MQISRALFALAVPVALALLPGCVATGTFEIQEAARPEFNPRIRLDREALDPDNQTSADPYRGPFRDGRDGASGQSELVSEIYPLLADGMAERLTLSNCYWVARNGLAGDTLAFSWEQIATLMMGAASLDCEESARRIGLCRLREPESGARLVLREDGGNAPCSVDPSSPVAVTTGVGFALTLTLRPGSEIVLRDDLNIHQPILAALADPRGDPDQTCPGSLESFESFAGTATALTALFGGDGDCTVVQGRVSSCGVRCGVQPEHSASYRIGTTGSPDVVRLLRPNLMVVDGTETLVRPMAVENPEAEGDKVLLWRTPATADLWHENFSPFAVVERARVFRRGGEKAAVEVVGDLEVSGSYPGASGPVAETWTCAGEKTDDGFAVPLHGVAGVSCNGADPIFTPTYARRHLDQAAAAITLPLAWRVTIADEMPVDNVFIEFTMRALHDPAALMMNPPSRGFGSTPVGGRRQDWLDVTNVGGQVVRIDSVALEGPGAAAFRFVLPVEARPVPLPVALDTSGKASGGKVPAADTGVLAELYEMGGGEAGGVTHLGPRDRDGEAETLYGEATRFTGSLLTYEDDDAVFAADAPAGYEYLAVTQAYRLRQPPFDLLPGESFRLLVLAEPGSAGWMTAALRVEGFPVVDPSERLSVASALVADALPDAFTHVAPTSLHFPSEPHAVTGRRSRALFLENPSHFDFTRGAVTVTGSDRAYFSLYSDHDSSLAMAPGDAEIFRLEYLPDCAPPLPADGMRRAVLEIETDPGTVEVPLSGPLDCP